MVHLFFINKKVTLLVLNFEFFTTVKKKWQNLRPADENPCKIKRQTIYHPYITFKSYKKGLQEVTRGLLGEKKGYRRLRGITGRYIVQKVSRLQVVTVGDKRLQGVMGGCRVLQVVTGQLGALWGQMGWAVSVYLELFISNDWALNISWMLTLSVQGNA